MNELDDLESRLRQFRPRRPATIPDERLQLLRGPIWLGVAAVIAAAMLITVRMQRTSRPPVTPTLGALTTIALERPDDLDAVLTEISRKSLPDVTQAGGVLQPLSKF